LTPKLKPVGFHMPVEFYKRVLPFRFFWFRKSLRSQELYLLGFFFVSFRFFRFLVFSEFWVHLVGEKMKPNLVICGSGVGSTRGYKNEFELISDLRI
jgi:hypothetical protein